MATQDAAPESTAARASHWQQELAAAHKVVEKWHEQGGEVVKRYLDERETKIQGDTRWNLFTTNIETQQATLYGQTPRVSVTRRHADANDDVARVASEMMERLLNSDIEKDGDTYAEALQYALEDRLLPGLGQVRVRYAVDMEPTEETPAKVDPVTGAELAPAIPAGERKANERVETDYVHWRDFRWGPARTWGEVPWVAFKAQMSRDALVKRFGEEIGRTVPLNTKRAGSSEGEVQKASPRDRADVWEIWDKERREVVWYVEGFGQLLDTKADPLELDGFWPCPRPMLSLATTTALVPKPAFCIAQDLYDEVDTLSTRIKLLMEAIAVRGVYDKSNTAVRDLLTTNAQNALVPVDSWAAFAEKGGIKGAVDWLPLEQIVGTITFLSTQRLSAKDALYEVTGMADIMRGAAGAAGASATEQSIKAKFGSVRLQRMQDEFARFASDAQRLKAEIIARHFEPATIIECSNIQQTPDAPLAEQAVALIQGGRSAYRVEVKPEAISLQDFAQLKAEGMEVLTALGSFFQAVAPVAQAMPGSLPYMLQMLQWSFSRLRGASAIEGVLDQAIAAAQAAASQPQQQAPSPEQMKLQTQQLKGQQDLAKEDKKLQNALVLKQADVAAHAAQEQTQAEWNTREAAAKANISVATRATQPGLKPGGGL
jgi:hypothetical protein